jgi:hypothetical protein
VILWLAEKVVVREEEAKFGRIYAAYLDTAMDDWAQDDLEWLGPADKRQVVQMAAAWGGKVVPERHRTWSRRDGK